MRRTRNTIVAALIAAAGVGIGLATPAAGALTCDASETLMAVTSFEHGTYRRALHLDARGNNNGSVCAQAWSTTHGHDPLRYHLTDDI